MKINKIGILKEHNLKQPNILESLMNTGISCYCSDLARITGVNFDKTTGLGDYWVIQEKADTKKNKISSTYVTNRGLFSRTYNYDYKSGVRIAISFDDIEDFDENQLDSFTIEYPQIVVGGRTAQTLDKLFENRSNLIVKTGKQHFVNGKLYDELETFGIKFVKVPNNTNNVQLSDGTFTEKNHDLYLKIDTIPLVPDKEERIFYSPTIMFGTNFDKNGRDYHNSDLNAYLNGDFKKSLNSELIINEGKQSLLFEENDNDKSNRYGFEFTPITEEEILEICIISDIAVFLHGEPGSGKTARIVALDNDLELVDFGCTSSDGFTGIVAKDFNSRDLFLYEPYWYKSLCQKCKEQPNKLHILFLEELTNAKNDIQKVAFEVTLNKTLTNSGFRLKLPDNAVVIAAGNEVSDSRSANALSQPLFGRFAHVYINTSSEDWLKWALKRKKEGKELIYEGKEEEKPIHPAIIDYIRINGDKVLRTAYNGVTPNADPRKWALASKALYKSNNPQVLRAFIGEELTQDFIKFCQINLVTIDEVLKGEITPDQVPKDPSIMWYSTICLSAVDDENVDKVRDFVKSFGHEFLAVFDYEWSKDNNERIMRIYRESSGNQSKRLINHEFR